MLGAGEEPRGRSAEVALVVLYGFLDAEKHGGQPLVQPRNGVVLLHLRRDTGILPKRRVAEGSGTSVYFRSRSSIIVR